MSTSSRRATTSPTAAPLAFYDPETERVTVRGTEVDPGLAVTLVHELTHVLQDQVFGIGALGDPTRRAVRASPTGRSSRRRGAHRGPLLAELSDEDLSAIDAANEADPRCVRGRRHPRRRCRRSSGCRTPSATRSSPRSRPSAATTRSTPPSRTRRRPRSTWPTRSRSSRATSSSRSRCLIPVTLEVRNEGATSGRPSLYLVLTQRIDVYPGARGRRRLGWRRLRRLRARRAVACAIVDVVGDDDSDTDELQGTALEAWRPRPPGRRAPPLSSAMVTSCASMPATREPRRRPGRARRSTPSTCSPPATTSPPKRCGRARATTRRECSRQRDRARLHPRGAERLRATCDFDAAPVAGSFGRHAELPDRARSPQVLDGTDRAAAHRGSLDGSARLRPDRLVGPVEVGDEVVLNTTAVDLGLGTGGWHVVHWNLGRDAWSDPGPGHIMKLRYTSLQADTGAAEEHHPDLPATLDRACRSWRARCTARSPWSPPSSRTCARRPASPT